MDSEIAGHAAGWGAAAIGAAGAAFGAIVGAASTVIVARNRSRAAVAIATVKTAPEVQASIDAAVSGIILHYTQALTEQTAEVRNLRTEVLELRQTIERQNVEIATLNAHVIDLSEELARHGIAPPARPVAVDA